jgi:phosphoenolpyruvate carboxykinase (GTP)
MTPSRAPWWEGLDATPPESLVDWGGKPWTKASGTKAAHPNSRFTAPARQCPSLAREFDDPKGVPISAIVFGGRRAKLVPLVYEARDWSHGVYLGASLASETTAAATGAVGVVRRDPMAMLPFCGYHVGDYFAHWLRMGETIPKKPAIFHVNWFRQSDEGKYLWPGFGENLRVLEWIVARSKGRGAAVDSAIGRLPAPGAIDTSGLDVSPETMQELFRVDAPHFKAELQSLGEFFAKLGSKMPRALANEQAGALDRIEKAR